jgi:hypothetical protein
MTDQSLRGFPLPHPDNIAREDAARIRDAIVGIDAALTDLDAKETPVATESVSGRVRLATAEEATEGTADSAVPSVERVMTMIAEKLVAIVGSDSAFWRAITDALASKQPLDADLTEIAKLQTAEFGRQLLTATSAAAARSLVQAQQALGYTPLNKAGDTTTGAFGVTGNLAVTGNASFGNASISTEGNLYMPWCAAYTHSKIIHNTAQWYTTAEGWGRLMYDYGGTSWYRGGASAGWSHGFQIQEGTTRWLMNGNGDFYSQGNIVAYWSDARLKEGIETVDPNEGLDRVMRYRVVDYSWNEKGRELNSRPEGARERGLIAQEARAVNVETVCDNILGSDEDGAPYLSLKEEKIIFDLIGAIQAQQNAINDLRSQLAGGRHGNAG